LKKRKQDWVLFMQTYFAMRCIYQKFEYERKEMLRAIKMKLSARKLIRLFGKHLKRKGKNQK